MFKTYADQTLTPTDFQDDWDLLNAYGNTFDNCTFVGTFNNINFTKATFALTCDLSGAVFRLCNFTAINPGASNALDPSSEAGTFESNNVTSAMPYPVEAAKTGAHLATLAEEINQEAAGGTQPGGGGGGPFAP